VIRLLRIELLNWDLQANQHLVLQPGVNLLTGENGSGKTSILDAIKAALGASRGRGLGGDRTVLDYLRKRGAPVAMVRLVLGNPAREGTRRRPFDVLAAGFDQDLISAGVRFDADDEEGYRKTYFLADGDTSPLAPGPERKPQLYRTRKDYVERLDRLGLNESFRTLLCTPQGDIAALCKQSPSGLFSMLFDFIGGRQVLDEWERLRADYETLVRGRDEHRMRVGQAQKRLTDLERRLHVHQQFRAKAQEARVLGLAHPLAQLAELQSNRSELETAIERSKKRAAEELEARDDQLATLARFETEGQALAGSKTEQDRQQVALQDAWKTGAQELAVARARWQVLEQLRQRAELIPERLLRDLQEVAAEARRALARLEARGEVLEADRERLEEELRQIEERGALQPPEAAQKFAHVLGREKLPFQLLMDLVEPDGCDDATLSALEAYLGDLRFAVAVPDERSFVRAVALAREHRFPHYVLAPDIRARVPEGEHPLLTGIRVKEPRYRGLVVRLLRRVERMGSEEPIEGTFRGRGARVDELGYVLDRIGGEHRGVDRFFLGREALARRVAAIKGELAGLAGDRKALEAEMGAARRAIGAAEGEVARERMRLEWVEGRPEHAQLGAELTAMKARSVELDAALEASKAAADELQRKQVALTERVSNAKHSAERHADAATEAERQATRAQREQATLDAAISEAIPLADAAKDRLGAVAAELQEYVQSRVDDHAAETLHALLLSTRQTIAGYSDDDKDTNLPMLVQTQQTQVEDVRGELERIDKQAADAKEQVDRAHDDYKRMTRRRFQGYFARLGARAEPLGFGIDGRLQAREDGRFDVSVEVRIEGKDPVPYSSQSLSGGQKAALSLLMAMSTLETLKSDDKGAAGPGFFIVDEPFSASDTHKIQELGTFLERTGAQYLVSMPTTMDIRRCGAWLDGVLTCTKTRGGYDGQGELLLAPAVKPSYVVRDASETATP